MGELTPKYEQWYFQSDYDWEVAEQMMQSGRNVYSVFFCHLSLEKALKGLFVKRTAEFPAKTHNLMYFIDKLALEAEDEKLNFLISLNSLSIPTRYPEDLAAMMSVYTKERTNAILAQTKTIQEWIKTR